MPEIQYPKNPNSDTAFVVQEDGTKNRALMTAPQDTSSLELPTNSNSCKGYVTVDGKKQRVILTADIGGGGGSSLPDQEGHTGEFLTTDGTDASWAAVDALPDQTGNAGKFLTTDGTDASWSDKPLVNMARTAEYGGIVIGQTSVVNTSGIVIGRQATGTTYTGQIVIGQKSGATNAWGVAIGYNAHSTAEGAIQLSGAGNGYASAATNSESYTLKVCLGTDTDGSKNYKLLDTDGTIPEARLADTTNAAQGQVLTLDNNLNAVWQAGGGGGSSYTAGNGISIDANNEISVTNPVLVNTAIGTQSVTVGGNETANIFCTNVGYNSACNANFSISLGNSAQCSASATYGVVLGYRASTSAIHAIQIGSTGSGWTTNSDANTFKVANANGNYEIMSADGTVPTARLTKVNTTATLAVADWSNNEQTVTVSGVTATSVVFVSPAPASASDYASAGILCTSQGADSLTFSCTQTPSSAIVVNIVCM